MSIMHANIGLFLFCTNIEIWTNCPRKNDMFEMYLHDIIFADELQHKRDGTLTIPQNEDKGGARMRILAPIFFLYEILKPKMSSTRKKRC